MSGWSLPNLIGEPLKHALSQADETGRLDLGCVASHGIFVRNEHDGSVAIPQQKAATAFLFELIARLQMSATVPMIDIRAYARWL
jgi:hypothetical protein